jgi:hypothetical protein
MKYLLKIASSYTLFVTKRLSLTRFNSNTVSSLILIALTTALIGIACKKQEIDNSANETLSSSNESKHAETEAFTFSKHRGLNWHTIWQLQQTRAATARYRNFNNAIKDSFEDISVVVPNMGYHFMKKKIVDKVFDIRRPEILVYNKKEDGSFELGAVEFAIPIDPSNPREKAPEGFIGNADEWERNETFGLWLLHAWVWNFNPDGIFHETNPRVIVH